MSQELVNLIWTYKLICNCFNVWNFMEIANNGEMTYQTTQIIYGVSLFQYITIHNSYGYTGTMTISTTLPDPVGPGVGTLLLLDIMLISYTILAKINKNSIEPPFFWTPFFKISESAPILEHNCLQSESMYTC